MKHVLLISLTLLTAYITKAQCTPDKTIKSTGVYYNSVNIPCVGSSFDETVQLAIVNDTIVTLPIGGIVVNVKLDSLVIQNVTNLPAGLNYQCENASCTIIADPSGSHSHSCMRIYGIPTAATTNNLVNISSIIYASGNALPYNFSLPLDASKCVVGIDKDLNQDSFTLYPQPSKNEAKASIALSATSHVTMDIHNMLGEKVSSAFNGTLSAGSQTIDLSSSIETLDSGIYLINTTIVSDGLEKNITKKLIIE